MELSDEAYVTEQLFRIADKGGADVDFTLNGVQRRLDTSRTGRDLIPKARQVGVSSYYLARYTAACLGRRNVRAVVISHDQESTQRMLKRVKYFLSEIRGPAPVIQNMSANEITFPKTNSMFYIGTAGSRKFGRGDTITHLHCSEYAFWPDPINLMRGLMQAVPVGSGEIAIESTGNGLNDYYQRCMRAYQGRSRWKLHFFPWHEFPEYTLGISPEEEEVLLDSLDEEMEEPQLLESGITPGQLAWRRMKLEEMNFDLKSFKQEYPRTLDECFQTSGQSIFHVVRYDPTPAWKETLEPGFWVMEGHPNQNSIYVMGADVSAGVGRDSSVAEIFDLVSGEQVAEYANSKIDPDAFGLKLKLLGDLFGYPYLVVESNNHGLLTLATLDKVYPPAMLHTEDFTGKTEDKYLMSLGSRTTAKTKPLMIGRLRTFLVNVMKIHSPLLNSQLSTFIEHEGGKLEAQKGCYDDTVMASACAAIGWERAAAIGSHTALRAACEPAREATDPFSFDAILKEMQSKGWGYPIERQDDWTVH